MKETDHLSAQPTLDDRLRAMASAITHPVARLLARIDVHPNAVTIVGFLLNAAAGLIAALGRPGWGGLAMVAASSTDAFDGALARVSGKQSRFGAFFDSTLDRLSEGAVLFGLAVAFYNQGQALELYLTFLALLGSVMVSYTRARAEGVGYACKVGLFTRPVRVAVLGLAMLSPWLRYGLILLTALTWFTVGQRILHVYRAAKLDP
jgi:CDP-diacylglycerol--glycerol-3-phosphate 3-phosphatidyltransferase